MPVGPDGRNPGAETSVTSAGRRGPARLLLRLKDAVTSQTGGRSEAKSAASRGRKVGFPRRLSRNLSLRARLVAGVGLIAAVSLGAAALVVYGAWETTERIDVATAAQARMEILGALSGRINSYAIVAVEAAGSDESSRLARLQTRAETVQEAFERADRGLAQAVGAARDLPEAEQMARATRGLGLARMRAQFESLHRRLTSPGFQSAPERLRAELDSFATQFSPLLDQQIGEERRARDQAFASVRWLTERLVLLASGLAVVTLAGVALFHSGIARPLLARLGRFGAAAGAIGGGARGVRMDIGRHDELGLVASQINRMAARLDRRGRAVAEDRRRLEEIIDERTGELRRANERLERVDASRRRFFADVGHELRTPLTVIRAEADLAVGDGSLDAESARHSLDVIRTRAARLNRRVNDLLRVARSESGEIALERRPFDLAVSVQEAMEDASFLADRRRVALVAGSRPEEPAVVAGDPEWTRQVIAGLIENAVRHSPEGGRIRLDCQVEGGWASATVMDEGSGIAEDEMPRLFERFHRGVAAEPGFGIGLALAKWVLEQQSGTVRCDSPAPFALSDPPKGPGARFSVTMPRESAS